MKKYSILLILLIFGCISGCESPTDGFERTNTIDPLSPAFSAVHQPRTKIKGQAGFKELVIQTRSVQLE